MRYASKGIGLICSLVTALLVMLLSLAAPITVSGPVLSAPDASSWTIMVYMAADVTDSLPWQLDINEMEAAEQAVGTNVIVLADPPGASDTMLLKIEHDDDLMNSEIISSAIDDEGAIIQGEGDVNTGSPDTLRNFIVFSASEFPADNLVLILWGHGNGWRGLCPDGVDPLTLPELRSALVTAEDAIGRGLDLLILDVCAGATMELAYEIQGCVNLIVGSELSVPAAGFPYMDILNALAAAPHQSPTALGTSVAELYLEWGDYGSANPIAACLFDLRLTEGLFELMDSGSSMGLRFAGLYGASLSSAIRSSEHTEDEWLVDFGRLLEELCSNDLPLEIRLASLRMAMTFASAVAFHGESNTEQQEHGPTTGLSLYVPSGSSEDESYWHLRISDTAWPDLSVRLRDGSSAFENGPGPSLEARDSESDDDDLVDTARLLWEDDEPWNYTSFEVHVYRQQQDGLIDCQTMFSDSPEIEVSNTPGSLLLAASAYIDDEIRSYHILSTILYKTITLDLSVRDGAVVPEAAVDIILRSQSGDSIWLECENGTCSSSIVVPEWTDAGEIVTLQVIDARGGEMLSEGMIRITGEDATATLYIHWPDEASPSTLIFIGLAIAVALMAASTAIYVGRLKER
ncbi:MAG: hypothetical protein JSU93_06940 [Methanobacteriota archaeon]|nr:MAG: hypothetical protein JSU93_06940 [Euryarchaeota archaeon]